MGQCSPEGETVSTQPARPFLWLPLREAHRAIHLTPDPQLMGRLTATRPQWRLDLEREGSLSGLGLAGWRYDEVLAMERNDVGGETMAGSVSKIGKCIEWTACLTTCMFDTRSFSFGVDLG